MRAIIDYRPERMMYFIYLESGGCAFYRDAEGQLRVEQVKLGDEMPVYMQLPHEEYRAIADAILKAESPRLAEAALLQATLDDAKEIRDRLLALVESGWES